LRSLTATIPAQPNETGAALHPRDPAEQTLAAQIVAAHYAALDCLSKAAETENPAQADHLRRSYTMMTRTMQNRIRLLERQQQNPAAAAPPPRRPAKQNATHYPMQSEKPPAASKKDLAKMTDDELQAALTDMRAQAAAALFDKKHPLHREALRMLPEILPSIVVPDTWSDDAPAMAA
jgi:hypothetical protein